MPGSYPKCIPCHLHHIFPQEWQHSPSFIILSLPHHLLSLCTSALLVSHRDVINHVGTLLLLILRLSSFPSHFIQLCLLESLSMTFYLSLTHTHRLINHLFTQESSVMHASGIIWWLAFLVFFTILSLYSGIPCAIARQCVFLL